MKSVDTQTRIEMLERTVLDLGSELYQLRGVITKSQASHEQFLAIIKGLKQLLDEKGLITLEDFDAAVELGEAIEHFNAQRDAIASELTRVKKTGH